MGNTIKKGELIMLYHRYTCSVWRDHIKKYLVTNFDVGDEKELRISNNDINRVFTEGTEEQKKDIMLAGITPIAVRPKSWEAIIENFGDRIEGYFMDSKSGIYHSNQKGVVLHKDQNKNIFKTMAQAEAMRALAMLSQIIPYYVGDWVPDWQNQTSKYVVIFKDGKIDITIMSSIPHFLSFPTSTIAFEFIEQPEIAKLITKARPFI